jgi:hypothetical protein
MNAYRHGRRTAQAIAGRKALNDLLRKAREAIDRAKG